MLDIYHPDTLPRARTWLIVEAERDPPARGFGKHSNRPLSDSVAAASSPSATQLAAEDR